MTGSHRATVPATLAERVAPERTALILWDMQKGLAGRAPDCDRVRSHALKLIDAADRAGVLVIWSRHVLPSLDLTVGPFLEFLMRKQRATRVEDVKPFMQRGMADTDFIDGMQPGADHLVIEKSMPSLFVDTPLDLRLKARDIRSLVLAGVATDIGVEFTARHAMAKGYFAVIAEDATASYTDAAQQRSVAFMRDWFTVTNTEDVCACWS